MAYTGSIATLCCLSRTITALSTASMSTRMVLRSHMESTSAVMSARRASAAAPTHVCADDQRRMALAAAIPSLCTRQNRKVRNSLRTSTGSSSAIPKSRSTSRTSDSIFGTVLST